ncbi:fungal specific transcription factor domain-containing protein [Seiridium cupressi]
MAAAGVKERKEVQFVGTTRPAFALNVAKATLSVLDETSDDSSPEPDEPPMPSSQSPEMIHSSAQDPLLRMPLSAVYRLLNIFQDEIEPVYPLLDTANLRSRAAEMIKQFEEEYTLKFDGRLSQKDIHLLKIVLATAIVLESQGKTELSSQLISSFEDDALRITSPSDVDLQEAQIFAIMKYWDLNPNDLEHRSLAVRVFWCIYVLDRRWSFGTGLSFALIDRDLDPRLPEPSVDIPYFRCLVAYAKLCSEVWDAIPHYGFSDEAMPAERESLLESEIQGWLTTIPEDLQLTRTGSSPATDTAHHHQLLFQHMQTLLYLRGNYIRCLIHRHHVVSQTAILKNPGDARLVVSIAQDTIRILVNLNDTSHIYSRHQVAYNFFLLSAVSILLLAVCHAPAEFAQICRQDFFAAINLVRGFSRLSLQGRRLWSSIRGLVTRLKQIGIMNDDIAIGRKNRTGKSRKIDREGVQTYDHASVPAVSADLNLLESNTNHEWRPTGSTNFQTTTPDMNLMGDDLMGVFDTFGGAYMDNIDHSAQTGGTQFDGNLSFLRGDADDISDYFMGLL